MITVSLCFYLFYGVIQERLLHMPYIGGIGRYRTLLPAIVLAIIAVYILVRRASHHFERLTLYLNTLFIFLCLVDIANIMINTGSSETERKGRSFSRHSPMPACENCPRPDIFFIIMDEYCGSDILRNEFHYDNNRFESFLRSKGFYIAANPSSNYAATALSMASTMNMDYLDWLHRGSELKVEDYSRAEKKLSESLVLTYMQSMGYTFYNHSIFDIGTQPSYFNTGLMPTKLKLITEKTLINRVEKDVLWNINIAITSEVKWMHERFLESFRRGNKTLLSKTREILDQKTGKPKFVYTHLTMPHWPILYDSLGNKVNKNSLRGNEYTPDDYLQYLVYTNKLVSLLVSDIMDRTDNKAVIVLMSDHGIKALGKKDDPRLSNKNFNSVYLPSKDYRMFYDSISNVNQFRALFNTLFATGLPFLPDKPVL